MTTRVTASLDGWLLKAPCKEGQKAVQAAVNLSPAWTELGLQFASPVVRFLSGIPAGHATVAIVIARVNLPPPLTRTH